ncbi:MAG: hypothetical protein ACKO81_08500, partial [Planctomycetota bacterium]
MMGLLSLGCRPPEAIVLGNQKAYLSDAFTAFKKSIQQDGQIPLDPSGIPDLQKLGVSLPSGVNGTDVFWRKNLGAEDIESKDGEYVIGMIPSDTDEDLSFHVFKLYSNGMIVSSGTSKQYVNEMAKKLKQ